MAWDVRPNKAVKRRAGPDDEEGGASRLRRTKTCRSEHRVEMSVVVQACKERWVHGMLTGPAACSVPKFRVESCASDRVLSCAGSSPGEQGDQR